MALVLLTLYGVTVFAQSIEDAVRTRVRVALDREGMGWASVEVSGQNVLLRGVPPNPVEAQRARQLAEGTTCPTWLGERDCTVEVRTQFSDVPAAPPADASVRAEEADACDRDFAALLSRSEIQFETGGHDSGGEPVSARESRGARPRLSRMRLHRGLHGRHRLGGGQPSAQSGPGRSRSRTPRAAGTL
jgi:hypothetical protein